MKVQALKDALAKTKAADAAHASPTSLMVPSAAELRLAISSLRVRRRTRQSRRLFACKSFQKQRPSLYWAKSRRLPMPPTAFSSQAGYSWDQRFFQRRAALISQDTHTHTYIHIYSSSRTPPAIGELVPELGLT